MNDSPVAVSVGPLEKLDVHPILAKGFQRALIAEFGHNSALSKKQNLAYARYLVCYLQQLGFHHTVPLPAGVMVDIHQILCDSGLKNSTCQTRQNVILSLLRWCHRNLPDVISRDAKLDVPGFVREASLVKSNLSVDAVKKILSACYLEIDEIELRLNRGRDMMSDEMNSVDRVGKKLVEDLLLVGNGRIPIQRDLLGQGLLLPRRVQEYGGLYKIRSQLYFMHEDVLPFYIAVLAQSAGNPMAVQEMEMDCVESHPLRRDLEYLIWEKRRSSSEQRVEFPVDKKWSAPNLVRRILALNAPLREYAIDQDRSRLFLSHSSRSQVPTVPSAQSLHNALSGFVKRHNLENFDFRDFRKSSATAHRVAGGTIEIARKKLNHRNSSTTAKYYSGPEDVSQANDAAIVGFQGLLINVSAQGKNLKDSCSKFSSEHGESSSPSETVFGFQCADPFAGIDGRSPKGNRCMHFSQCSTCPGAIIPVDDPLVIAKVISSQIALKDARARAEISGWDLRFNKLYASTLNVIEKEILPFVHADVLRVARDHIDKTRIPFLE